jgi:hypothetical protein
VNGGSKSICTDPAGGGEFLNSVSQSAGSAWARSTTLVGGANSTTPVVGEWTVRFAAI